MTSQERHQARYERRVAKRQLKLHERNAAVGGVDEAMSYEALYAAGRACCKGVRWKHSIQTFELHRFSITAVCRDKIKRGEWQPAKYVHFILCERGKLRPIDAPRVQDRQAHKAYTKNVLLPLYTPSMIYNNGASQKGKGLHFSFKRLVRDLHKHFNKWGRDGYIILIDFKQFFPSASHEKIIKRHEKLITDPALRNFGNLVVNSTGGDVGMPLGVEPSQAEMIALPSSIDNYMTCQMRLKGFGHYMDDYYILVPPDRDPKEILKVFLQKAQAMHITVSEKKTKIVPLDKPFKYCKAKFHLEETGRVAIHGNRDSMKRNRSKIKAYGTKIEKGEMTYEDLWSSVNAMMAYYSNFDDHNRSLKLRKLFYWKFGFSCERIEAFRERDKEKKDEIHNLQKVPA